MKMTKECLIPLSDVEKRYHLAFLHPLYPSNVCQIISEKEWIALWSEWFSAGDISSRDHLCLSLFVLFHSLLILLSLRIYMFSSKWERTRRKNQNQPQKQDMKYSCYRRAGKRRDPFHPPPFTCSIHSFPPFHFCFLLESLDDPRPSCNTCQTKAALVLHFR